MNPYLPPDEAAAVWSRFMTAACYGTLRDFQRRWIALYAAVAARDGKQMAALASELLATQEIGRDAREYLVVAGMAGYLASGQPGEARALWTRHESGLRDLSRPLLRLLRCHAEAGDRTACAAAFAAYAD